MSSCIENESRGASLDLSRFDDREGTFWDILRGRLTRGPASELLGWKLLDVDPDAGRIYVEYDAKPEFLNPMGIVHGGFVAAMLDDVMGPALACTHEPGKANPTLEIKVSYHRPARPGRLIAVGQLVHKGATVGSVEGRLYNEQEELLASATGTFRIISRDLSKGGNAPAAPPEPRPEEPDASRAALPDDDGHFWDVIHGRRPMPPSAAMLGWKVLEVDREKGWLRNQFTTQPEFLNLLGMTHGGFVAAMLDETMGPALVCSLPARHFCPTLELKVSYHRPVRPGRVFGEGRVLQKGGTIGFVEAKLHDAAGELLASSSGTFRILSQDRMRKQGR